MIIASYIANVILAAPDTLAVMWHHVSGLITPDIIPVPVESISDSMNAHLYLNGGHGVAGDGAEIIYIDRTSAIQSCFTDAECEYVSQIGAVN